MNQNELRIGNLVKNRLGKMLCVDRVLGDKIESDLKTKSILISRKSNIYTHPRTELIAYLKPVPITKEWFIKFGFKEIEENYFDIKISSNRALSIDVSKKMCYVGNSCHWISIKFPEYIHQLQNLYFALTGEELILNQQ